MAITLDKAAGAKGEHAEKWVAFSDAAIALLDAHEDAYSLIHQLVGITEAWWEENG